MLIFVTVVAVGLWQWQRALYLLREAAEHDAKSRRSMGTIATVEIEQIAIRQEFHREMANCYRQAAWLPWVSSLRELPEPGAP